MLIASPKSKELGDGSKFDPVRGCSDVSTKQDGTKRLSFTANSGLEPDDRPEIKLDHKQIRLTPLGVSKWSEPLDAQLPWSCEMRSPQAATGEDERLNRTTADLHGYSAFSRLDACRPGQRGSV